MAIAFCLAGVGIGVTGVIASKALCYGAQSLRNGVQSSTGWIRTAEKVSAFILTELSLVTLMAGICAFAVAFWTALAVPAITIGLPMECLCLAILITSIVFLEEIGEGMTVLFDWTGLERDDRSRALR